MSVFSHLEPASADPILGVTEAFNNDKAADKINLGVGVYVDETGRIPLMAAVRTVEQDLASRARPHGYLPQEGLKGFNEATRELVFGSTSPALADYRVVTLQGLGGTGALRLGAGVLGLATPEAKVLISSPTWDNHRLLFARAGFAVSRYRYYSSGGVDIEGLLEDFEQADPGTIVVLHGCCHNPTGCDLTVEQWDQVIEVVARRGLVGFIDLAYQGFSQGIDEDRYAVEAFARTGMPFLVANSFSKTFGLYGERVGAVHYVATSANEAQCVRSQAKTVARSLYSSPPTQGATIVTRVLGNPELRASWEGEVAGMRRRIKQMRSALRLGLEEAGVAHDLSYITNQAGMFSYSGLGASQMRRLRNEFHIYGLDSGRLCVAALNPGNIERVVEAVATVMKD